MSVIEVNFQAIRTHAANNGWSSYKIAKEAEGQVSPAAVVKIFSGEIKEPSAIKLKLICEIINFPFREAFIVKAAA